MKTAAIRQRQVQQGRHQIPVVAYFLLFQGVPFHILQVELAIEEGFAFLSTSFLGQWMEYQQTKYGYFASIAHVR